MHEPRTQELAAAFAGAPVGIGLWDVELRYRWVNDRLAEINGVPAAEHVGRTIPQVLPRIPATVVERYRGVAASGASVDGLLVHGETPADPGVARVWSVSIFPTRAPDGSIDGIASIVEEITALVEATSSAAELRDALALERRVLDEVVDRVPLGVTLLWGRELRYRMMNERGRRMLPERGPLVGRTPAEAFPETAATFAATVVPLFDNGEELILRDYPLPFDDDPGALDGLRYYDVTFSPMRFGASVVQGVLVTYLDVTDALRRRRVLEQELAEERQLTKTLQQALLPRRLPAVPHLEIAARYRPAGERYDIGGDFYDVFERRDGTWLVVVGDVCGKGPRAAARTSMVRYCLRAESAYADDPATLLELLNDDVRRELEQEAEEDFVTVVLAVLHPGPTGTDVRIATAGHPPAIITTAGGGYRTLGGAALPVGVRSRPGYAQHHDVLVPGERLVLHTDGLLDAHAPAVMLTTEDLAERASVAGNAGEIADAVLDHVSSSPVPARDDCAVVVLVQQDPATEGGPGE